MEGRRVAACQVFDRQDDVAGAVATVRAHAEAAATAGADLVCFPEGYLVGYASDPVVAGQRALDLRSSAFGEVLRALADCQPTIVVGTLELCGAELFHTAAVINRGELVGSYRKRHPHEPGFTPGAELPVFAAGAMRFGLGICSDARDPDDANWLSEQGVDAILYPLNNMLAVEIADRWRARHLSILAQRARDTATWIFSADVVVAGDRKISYGCTAAVDPRGIPRDRVEESHAGMVIVTSR